MFACILLSYYISNYTKSVSLLDILCQKVLDYLCMKE